MTTAFFFFLHRNSIIPAQIAITEKITNPIPMPIQKSSETPVSSLSSSSSLVNAPFALHFPPESVYPERHLMQTVASPKLQSAQVSNPRSQSHSQYGSHSFE